MHLLPTMKVDDIRKIFAELYKNNNFTTNGNKTGAKTVEIINGTFIADEISIFGKINHEYIERESQWYMSMSRNVNDIPGGTPKIWKDVATPSGLINSNYGWCVFSKDNHEQLEMCYRALRDDKSTRRAIVIYTRPSMQVEYNTDGMSDFMCTNTVQYFIRDNQLIACVSMRSNDAWAGYRNDLAWQQEVQLILLKKLEPLYPELKLGPIVWNAGSIHIYERQFYLIDHYIKTGETDIVKSVYDEKYGS
jgi:thymidylate synthase